MSKGDPLQMGFYIYIQLTYKHTSETSKYIKLATEQNLQLQGNISNKKTSKPFLRAQFSQGYFSRGQFSGAKFLRATFSGGFLPGGIFPDTAFSIYQDFIPKCISHFKLPQKVISNMTKSCFELREFYQTVAVATHKHHVKNQQSKKD